MIARVEGEPSAHLKLAFRTERLELQTALADSVNPLGAHDGRHRSGCVRRGVGEGSVGNG